MQVETNQLFQEEQRKTIMDQKVAEINDKLNWILTHKSNADLVEVAVLNSHKSVSVRRKLAEVFGLLGTEANNQYLRDWQQIESDRKTWISIEAALDKILRRKNGDQSNVGALSVTEALALIKNLVSEKIYTIEGEITEANTSGQMYYFSIKDGDQSVLSCWCFAGIIYRAGFPLNEGLSIRVTGKFKISGKSSRLYFDVQKLELTGEGEFLRNLKLLEEKLAGEGMMDPLRKRASSRLPERILLVASSNSAALTDYIKVMAQRRKGLTIYHLPIKTQGVGVEAELLEQFSNVNLLCKEYSIDTVVITRGGGSKEDLIVFNSEKVVRAIHAISRPTIVAIGHERDTSLAELVADLRASTPSQAAELSSLSSDEVSNQIVNTLHILNAFFYEKKFAYQRYTDQVCGLATAIVRQDISRIRQTTQLVDKSFSDLIYTIKLQNNNRLRQIESYVTSRILEIAYSVKSLQNLQTITQRQILTYRHDTSVVYPNLLRLTNQNIHQIKQNIDILLTRIELENPQTILKKGYAMVTKSSNQILSIADFKSGDELEIQMIDGAKKTIVK